jgi:serine O-acetyltransferase
MEQLGQYLFPQTLTPDAFLADHEDLLLQLRQGLAQLLQPVCEEARAAAIISQWQNQLGLLVQTLLADAQFMLDRDPAAQNIAEIISTYPGFKAVFYYRTAHWLCQQHLPLLPRLITEIAHTLTGIDIHPGATIGQPFCIDHGTGVVIGQTARIGARCTLYQGVTLGAATVKKELASQKRHPTLEDDVVVYANATILGGDTVIGKGSIIGGNTWVTQTVPPYHLVATVAQHNIVSKPLGSEPYNFVI